MVPSETVIVVDYSVRPTYPEWADPARLESFGFIQREKSGPSEFDVGCVKHWRHDGQRMNSIPKIKGGLVLDSLKRSGLIKNCLGLPELLEIQKRGPVFFRKHFKGKVYGWRSVTYGRDICRAVPFLCLTNGNKIMVGWRRLSENWHPDFFALHIVLGS